MKATHYGECQICGRKMKAPYGELSNHGYTIENGYFNGSCHGSHELPFEKDRSVLGNVIEDYSKFIDNKEQYMQDVAIGKQKYKVPVHVQVGYSSPKKIWVDFVSVRNESYAWDEDKTFEVFLINPKEIQGELWRFNRKYSLNDDGLIQYVNNEDDYYTGKERYRLKLSYELNNYKNLLTELRNRYNSWEIKELDPVA